MDSGKIVKGGFMDVSQVSRRLGVSASTIYRMIDEGALPAVRIRQTIKVPRCSVEEYLERQISTLT